MNNRVPEPYKSPKANKLLALIFILFLVELFYIVSNREQMNKEYQLLNEIKSLKTIHQRIDALFSKSINHQSFDSIVDDKKEFGMILENLENYSSFTKDKNDDAYHKVYAELKNNFGISQDYIERYKSTNGITINSTRVIYDMHGYIKELVRNKGLHEKEHLIEKQLDEIIYSVALINFDRLSNSSHLHKKMKVLQDELSSRKSFKKAMTNFSKHIRVILEGHELMQVLKEEHDLLRIGTKLDNMYNTILQDFKEKDKSSTLNIYILNGLVLLLLFFLFLIGRKETTLHVQVSTLNSELEDNINELESVNRDMKKLIAKFDTHVIASETDVKGIITYVSKAFCDISGYTKEELLGKPHNIVRHADVSKKVYAEMWKTILSGQEWSGEIKNRAKDGSFYWVDVVVTPEFDKDDNLIGFSAIRNLITAKKELEVLTQSLEEKVYFRTKELEEMVEKVEKLSVTDELTGLYNRRYYTQVINNEMKRAQRRKVFFGYLILDIDNFKLYNDHYGHQLGDVVLQKVSSSLISSLTRPDDVVFRMGGEEFVVIFTADSIESAVMFAQSIIKNIAALKIEHILNEKYQVITVSGGLVLCGPDKECFDEDSLYKRSDELLYEAKHAGRNCLKV